MHSALIIDDDIWMQRILMKNLKNYGFDELFSASNGFEGIALAVEHVPTLIVLDIRMKELDGIVTLKILKTINRTKEIPVIIASAVTDLEVIGKIAKAGTSHFISKPFTKSTLEEKLLDVYGEEKLNLIRKGEPITDDHLGYIPEEKFKQEEKMEQPLDNKESEIDKKDTKNLRNLAADKYSSEDKKNIDTLKKLLLRNK